MSDPFAELGPLVEDDRLYCVECGEEVWLDDHEVAYHTGDGPDGIDYDADADHVAIPDVDDD